MFQKLLEAVIKCMIVFQVLNFDPVTEILKIRCHFYILMKIVIILRKIHVKMKSFAPPQKETKHIFASAADPLHTVLEQEISIGGNARSSYYRCFAKKVFLKNLVKFTGNSCARGKICEFCKIFKSTLFTEQIRTTASESGYCNNEAKNIDCIFSRELGAMLIASAKIPQRKGRVSSSSFFGHLPDYQSNLLILST